MEYFPQLETGAMGQYPLRRVRRKRTIENWMAGGERVRFADAAAETTEWKLEFRDLTDVEAETLAQFFETVEGRLYTFTFLDPADNLLAWSEKLDEAAWAKAPLTAITGSLADAWGGLRAWRIGGPGQAGVAQTLNVPALFCYCLSVYARCDGEADVALVRGGQRSAYRVSANWRRLAFPSSGEGDGEGVRFGVELVNGGAVDVCGLQVEPQMGASGYKKTTSRCGIYGNARLGEDRLELTATAPGRHDCALSVIHGEHI
jgi:hypothetical protein